LLRLEPRLGALQAEVDAAVDDGKTSFFCSNYLWLPVNTRLRLLIGVARTPQPGDEAHPELYDSRSYERVFEHLSRRLPARALRGAPRRSAEGEHAVERRSTLDVRSSHRLRSERRATLLVERERRGVQVLVQPREDLAPPGEREREQHQDREGFHGAVLRRPAADVWTRARANVFP